MTASILATSQLTLTDLHDAIISGSAPTNKVDGMLWVDSSQSPPVLKKWDETNTVWVTQSLSLQGLDPTQYTAITNATTQLANMADDTVVTPAERSTLSDTINN